MAITTELAHIFYCKVLIISKMNTNLKEVQNDICRIIQSGVQNSEIVTTIECLANYLNLISVAEWAKKNNIDYTNAKYRIKRDKLEIITIFGKQYLIDNE